MSETRVGRRWRTWAKQHRWTFALVGVALSQLPWSRVTVATSALCLGYALGLGWLADD